MKCEFRRCVRCRRSSRMDVALCRHVGEADAPASPSSATSRSARGASRSATSSNSDQILRADEGRWSRAPMAPSAPVHMVPTGSGRAGWSRQHRGLHDDAGIKWPEAVAPLKVCNLNLKQARPTTDGACEQLLRGLTAKASMSSMTTATSGRARNSRPHLIGIPGSADRAKRGCRGKVESAPGDGSRELISSADASNGYRDNLCASPHGAALHGVKRPESCEN